MWLPVKTKLLKNLGTELQVELLENEMESMNSPSQLASLALDPSLTLSCSSTPAPQLTELVGHLSPVTWQVAPGTCRLAPDICQQAPVTWKITLIFP